MTPETPSSLEDTIAALATAAGEAAIAMVRISGPSARQVLERVFQFRGASAGGLKPRRVTLGAVVNPETGQPVDEALAVWYPAPRSYTGEEMVEITCHGGGHCPYAALRAVLAAGARLAEPGEFTRRAYLNGKLGLSQAEAVADLIAARSQAQAQAALRQLSGGLRQAIDRPKERLKELVARLEAYIDFPDDEVPDVPESELFAELDSVVADIDRLLSTWDYGRLLRHGVTVSIIGKPNVGKSSLLNALLARQRAIVTDVPGTTRDLIEAPLTIGGAPVTLIDTAGIRSTTDPVETEGVQRAQETAAQAQLVLAVFDPSSPWTAEDSEVAHLARRSAAAVLAVLNKRDLPSLWGPDEVDLPAEKECIIRTSARTLEGLADLQECMWRMVSHGIAPSPAEENIITSERHYQRLTEARKCVATALENQRTGMPEDIVALDVRAALNALSDITGETTTEDLLDMVFSRFCIGK